MKKKILLFTFIMAAFVCILAISASAEAVYVNSNGEQVEAGSTDIAYEIEILNPWDTGGGCRLTYIYLHDTSITKIVIPAIKLTKSEGVVYEMAKYSYVRLSTGWGSTLSVYTIDDKETKANSLHAQIKELELHVPVLADGAGNAGNLAGWSGLEKLSFYERAYEPQNKGGFLANCTSIKEIHFYGQNNVLSGNFFPSTMTAGGKVVFHENATGVIFGSAMQAFNGKDITVYMNALMQPNDATDPRLTWNKNGTNLKFVCLVDDKSGYTPEEIASYETIWMAGNNKNDNNAKYSMPILTYCEYYGEHRNVTEISPCASKCLACQLVTPAQSPVHNITTTMEYTSFVLGGNKITKCLNDSCPLNTTPTVVGIDPLFTCLGYSASENGDGGIAVGYTVNKTAINTYEEFANVSLNFGVFAISQEKLGTGDVFDENGSLAANAISFDVTGYEYSAFVLKIVGFTDAQKDVKLAMGAYVAVNDGEKTTYSYMQDDKKGEKIGDYYFASYNDVLGIAPEQNA